MLTDFTSIPTAPEGYNVSSRIAKRRGMFSSRSGGGEVGTVTRAGMCYSTMMMKVEVNCRCGRL